MRILIIKLNATGDVVRTTPLLRRLDADITWLTHRNNVPLLTGLAAPVTCLAWEQRDSVADSPFDLVISLEDEREVAAFVRDLRCRRVFGAYLDGDDRGRYSEDAHGWFDLSLISRYGREKADELKYRNRQSYQELLFQGLGLEFRGEAYLLPEPVDTDLVGDVAIAPVAGAVWPMKNWAHYDALRRRLEDADLRVNVLPLRPSLLEHLGDIRNHRCLVSGDSLPMHLALGLGIRCVTLFSCTSPWEIFDYGLQTKLISPLLGEFFYKRGFDPRAMEAIGVDEVLNAVMSSNSAESIVDCG
ncbi:MAG: glycosyltransferase family 9 protein [Rhodospirillales bacterium]